MEKDLQKILTCLKRLLPSVISTYDVDTLEVFGSFAKNEQHSSSDLDILVTFTKVPSLLKFLSLRNYLSDQLGLKVDLVMKDSLKAVVKQNITAHSIPI